VFDSYYICVFLVLYYTASRQGAQYLCGKELKNTEVCKIINTNKKYE
jgi:hypothetical protein